MGWTFTLVMSLASIGLSGLVLVRERAAYKERHAIKGFVIDRDIRSQQIYFTLLSVEEAESLHFVLPLEQQIKSLEIGDFVSLVYDQRPFHLIRPIHIRTIEKIIPVID